MGDRRKIFNPRWWRHLAAGLLLVLLALPGFAQAPQARSHPAPAATESAPRRVEKNEHHISPAEAQELFRSVDSVLKFDSEDTGLPIHHPVKRALTSRDEVEKYVRHQLDDDKETRRLRRSEAVLKKFGLLPRNYNLEKLLIDVLREQIAGYYDPKTQTIYLLDWIAPEEQKGVMAHELTHALQDQAVHLDKWLKDDDIGDASTKELDKRDQRPQDISQDEMGTARQAVMEGQATVVFLDYFLSKAGRSVLTDPEDVQVFQEATGESGNMPVFRDAPLYLREALVFPYKWGIGFERELLFNGGRRRAFEDVLKAPPLTSRQIMEPKTYLAGERIPPMRIPAMKPLLGNGYERFDLDSIGEFDVYVILKQFAGEKEAESLSKQWRGGVYYAARRLDDPPPPDAGKKGDSQPAADQSVPPESLALMYVSRWGSAQAAEQFARFYAEAMPQRYKDVRKAPPITDPKDFAERVANHTKWLTRDGPVFVENWGQTVLVMESFDDATAAKIRDAVLAEKELGER